MPVIPSTANVWALVIVGRADGIVTVSPVNVPILIHQKIMYVLREHDRKVVQAIPQLD